jgi:hypothetical protein
MLDLSVSCWLSLRCLWAFSVPSIFPEQLTHANGSITAGEKGFLHSISCAGVFRYSCAFLEKSICASGLLQDVNGDGENEIIIQSRAGVGAHGGGWEVLTIFDHLGQEITRQPNCKWMRNDAELALAQACPIAGSPMREFCIRSFFGSFRAHMAVCHHGPKHPDHQ